MKFLIVAFLVFSSSIGQTRDISKLSESQKKQELIETLEWIQSKTGKNLKSYNVVDKVYRYCSLEFNKGNPIVITIKYINFDDDSEYQTYTFNLNDIYTVGVPISNRGFMSLHTYSQQRLIDLRKDGKVYITDSATISYDNIVSNERMERALNYAIKLANGGKKILKEKF